jgi:hypothetical protein
MMRQYTSGRKFPTLERVLQIQKTIDQLGKDLQQTKVAMPKTFA